MNKAAPWNVRGVGLDSREAAREAARRAGMSLGEWLDSVIAEEAAALGVDAEDINADDRLEAVTAKLSRLTGAPSGQRKAARPRPRLRSAREEAAADDYENEGRRYGYGDAGPVAPRRAPPAPDPEALLDSAVDRMEQHAATAQRQTNAALESVAARLEDIETHITARRDDSAIQPIHSAIGRLEERMESLSRRPAPPRADPRVEASLRDLTSRLDEVAHMIDRSASAKAKAPDEHIHRLDAKLSSIMSQLSESDRLRASIAAAEERARRAEAEQRAIAAKAKAPGDDNIHRLDAKLSSIMSQLSESDRLRDSVAAAEERARRAEAEQRAITAEAEKRARQTESDLRAKAAETERRARQVEAELREKAADADKLRFQAETERLAEQKRRPAQATRALSHMPFTEAVSDIERRQRQLDGAAGRGRAHADPAFDQRLEQIASRIEKAADAASGAGRTSDEAFGALHGEISRLAKRLDDMRSDAQRPAAMHPDVVALKRDITEMSHALADLAPRGSVSALESAVRDLATRIELSRQDGARDTLLAPVEALVSDLQATLKDFDPRRTVAALDHEIKNIGRKVDTMTITGFDPEAFKRIHSQSQEIRDLLTAAASRPPPVDKIEKQIATLGARIDQLTQAQTRAPQPDMTSAIGEIRTMFDRAMVTRITPPVNIDALEKRLESLALKIDQAVARPAPAPAAAPDMSGLERMMTRFAERVETARQTNQDPRALEALHKQIAQINLKLDTSDVNQKTLGAIEASIGDLFQGLERNRAAAVGAAENAARAAAIEAAERATEASLRQVAQTLPQGAGDAAETLAIKRDLVGMRAEQDATGKRATAALNAVHVTLEKIVDRLSSIESRNYDTASAFGALEDTRRGAAEAARDAARAAVNEAMASLPAHTAPAAETVALERGLIELRVEQEAAGKRSHATLSAVHGTLEKLVDRLAALEETMPQAGLVRHDETRELAIEAARMAARETLREHLTPAPGAAIEAEQIKADVADLRVMHEEAGERTHSTLKAVHATLEKVVDRLSTLENAKAVETAPFILTSAPPIMRERAPDSDAADETRAPLFVPAPRRFDMAVDPRTLRAKPVSRTVEAGTAAIANAVAVAAAAAQAPVAAKPALAPTHDGADMLLEPGSGFPPHRGAGPVSQARPQASAPMPREEPAPTAPAASAPASFIAAARRAAQAAAAETAARPAKGAQTASTSANGADTASQTAVVAATATGKLAQAKAFVSTRKRPILIGLTGLMVVLGASMLVRSLLGGAPVQKVDVGSTEIHSALEPALPLSLQTAPRDQTASITPPAAPPAPTPGQPLPIVPFNPPATQAQIAAHAALAIPGDVASRGPAAGKGKQLTAAVTPSPAADPGAAPARPGATDPTSVAAIEGKAGNPVDPALSAISPALRLAALGGSAAAQFEMGLRLAEGRTVPRDLKTAALWLEKSASQGLAPAQYRIGSLYEKGLGVTRDIGQAKNWYTRAAEGGNTRAMHNLAVLTAEGAGAGKPDYAGAAQWFKKAAEFGVRDSQYNLAILYARGLGIEQSLTQSYTWFAVAAAQGDEDAGKKRDEIAGKLDAKALAAAKTAAETFRPAPAAAASNDVTPPAGGWDATAQKGEGGKIQNKI